MNHLPLAIKLNSVFPSSVIHVVFLNLYEPKAQFKWLTQIAYFSCRQVFVYIYLLFMFFFLNHAKGLHVFVLLQRKSSIQLAGALGGHRRYI